MRYNHSSTDNVSQVQHYMKLMGESPYIFVHYKDITFAAYVVDDTTITLSQIEVKVHPNVQIDSSYIEEGSNITLFMIFGLVYEAKLDPQIIESENKLDFFHNSYSIFMSHLSRNLFIAVEHKDRWGDYVDPFLFELADAILRKTSVFSSLIYNLGFKIEWKQEKIVKLTWFPLHLVP